MCVVAGGSIQLNKVKEISKYFQTHWEQELGELLKLKTLEKNR